MGWRMMLWAKDGRAVNPIAPRIMRRAMAQNPYRLTMRQKLKVFLTLFTVKPLNLFAVLVISPLILKMRSPENFSASQHLQRPWCARRSNDARRA